MSNTANAQDFSIIRQFRQCLSRYQEVRRRWFQDDVSEASQSMVLKETHLPRLLTLTMTILSAATAIFFLWAALTPVKELARTEGQVLPAGYSQVVQHLEGGLVRDILVHEGDFVQKDQLLMQLDGAGLEEDYHEQQALVESLSLQSERLQALLENRSPDFSALSQSPDQIAEQMRMYQTMRDAQASERAVIDEQIAQKSKAVTRLQQALDTSYSNLGVAEEDDRIYADLNSKGLTARTSFLKKNQELNSQRGEVNTMSGQLEESKRELNEYMRRRDALVAQQRDTAYTELNKVRSDLAQAQQNLKKRNDRVTRLSVRAPVMGYVKGLRVNTIGAVIPAGQTLMEIVPVDERLVVEARILPQQVGRVEVGQEVQVKIDSYDYVRFGTIPGTLESISAMTFTDEIRRQDYYKGRVRLSKNYAGPMPGTHLILPGMTADADIVVGEKSVLGYLLKPIQIAMHNAMTEQ
jgi:HlyD family secretion protein/adhesin transport system membrane fusion protein